MRVIVTGSRDLTNQHAPAIWKALCGIHNCGRYAHVGLIRTLKQGWARGADWLGNEWALGHEVDVVSYPANWREFKNDAGKIRNQEMVDSGAELVVAFPLPTSVGTFDCIRRAQKAGIPVVNGWTGWDWDDTAPVMGATREVR